MTAKIEWFYSKFYDFIMLLCKLLLVADIGITSYAVLGRYISFIDDPAWSEEIVLTCMIYMAFLSAALATKKQTPIRMTTLDKYLPVKAVQILDVFGDLMVMAFALIMLFIGGNYAMTIGARGFYVSLPWLSKFWLYAPVAIAGFAMVIFELEILIKHVKVLFGKGGDR